MLSQIYRVLKPGGFSIFWDGAVSEIWQRLKVDIFRPLTDYTHKRNGISPEDLRVTLEKGGYGFKELLLLSKKHNYRRFIFSRYSSMFFKSNLEIIFFASESFGYNFCLSKLLNLFVPKNFGQVSHSFL